MRRFKKYKEAVPVNRKTCVILVFYALSVTGLQAQNINTPNRQGPLGIQVNTISGNVFINRTDIFIPARGFDLVIGFAYNSFLFSRDDGYGKGWTFNYSIKYRPDTLPGSRVIVWGDGREDRYDSLGGGFYRSPRGYFSRLRQYQPNQYVLTDKDSVQYFFDNPVHRRITKMQEPNGNFLQFAYTDSLLSSITNTAGQTISFSYHPSGKLAAVVDAMATPARTFTYTYNAAGNLTEVNDPLNGKFRYGYLVNGPMKSLTDKNNNKVDIIYYPNLTVSELVGCNKRLSFSYDTVSKKTVVTDHLSSGNQVTTYAYKRQGDRFWLTSMSGNCCGFNVAYEYDDQGNVVKMTDANSRVYTYTYDDRGNMLSYTDPLNQTGTYTYTADYNKISSFKDPKGNLYTLQYDSRGNLTQLITPGNNIYAAAYNGAGDIISSTDPRGNSYHYSYDVWGNPLTVTGPNGYQAVLAFDARGNLLSFTDARGHQSTGEYDILDRLKRITDPYNRQIQYNYDPAGNLVSLSNKNNEISLFNYDASNRLVRMTGPTQKTVSFTYDGMDKLTGMISPLGDQITYRYDRRNRLRSQTDPEGNETIYDYDGNGNITRAALPNGRVITYTYDANNRLLSMSDATSQLAAFTYDKNGNITSYTNATGAVVAASYDSLNRLRQLTDPLGYTTQYAYDRNNNITGLIDREGRTRTYTYDSLGRLKTFTDNNGHIITVTYDALGNITQLKDQNNNITTYTYDSLNRRKRMTYPDNRYQEFGYDAENNIVSNRLTDGTVITYQYDTLNRLKTKILPGGELYSYQYDDRGRILSATNSSGTASFTYDALSRVTSETFDGRTTRYQYSISGRTQTTVYPDSTTVVKEFDTRNRLIRIRKDSILVSEYSYNNANQLTGQTLANGISTVRQYDFANRLSLITTSGNIQNSSFSYDKERNKTAIIRNNNPALSEQFSYDNSYRLTNYKRGPVGSPVIQNTYAYDPVGNRLSANLNGTATSYTVNNLNQITAVNTTAFTYDDRGNLTFDGLFHKFYDAENRLKKDSASPGSVITYGYDALDRRVIKSLNGVSLKYTYSGAAPIEERDQANQLLNRTVFSGFLAPVMQEQNGERFYYHPNEMMSVEAISNSNGRLIETYRYDAYGKPARFDSLNNPLAGSLAGNRFGFTGQEYDSASGSYRFFFRNYSPETGLFNQRDPIEYEDGMGMYQYVGNNPANGVDVWGLKCKEKGFIEDMGAKTISVSGAVTALDEFNTANYESFIKGLNASNGTDFLALNQQIINDNRALDAYGDAFNSIKGNGTAANNARKSMTTGIDDFLKPVDASSDIAKAKGTLKMTGNVLGGVDLGYKGYKLAEEVFDGQQSNEQNMNEWNAFAEVGISAFGFSPPGAIVGIGDVVLEKATGKGVVAHGNDLGSFYGSLYAHLMYGSPLVVDGWDRGLCPEQPAQGTQESWWDIFGGSMNGLFGAMNLVAPFDPNEIIGPAGQPDQAWVSVRDRLPYTINFENDSNATARARFVRVTTPIEPKQDPATLELGSVGFNNQSFDIPVGTASYYQRLDARDSTGVFVDLTAGYDVFKNEVFWEFQAIDPVTLLPPDDPEKGFLFLADSLQYNYGKGFVNFSIKPRANAQTLDTIGAKAFIIFDENEVIPTNIHKNTIDALPPVSQMQAITSTGTNPITLNWSGTDDPGGCGIDYYTVYVTTDQINYSILFPRISRTDTTFSLPTGFNYCFFVLATDRVGNMETLRPGVTTCTSIGNPLPVTWLYFNGTNQGKNNLLKWATASEQNSREFRLERSLNGSDFTQIAVIPAAGNSPTERRYIYTDTRIDLLNSRVMFYRLKQVDLDGQFRYSTIVRLNYSQNGTSPSVVYPNPTRGFINILAGDPAIIGKEAVISDINGRILKRMVISATNQQIDLSPYANGLYLIRLANQEVLRVMKQ